MSNQNLGDTSREVSAILVILLLQYYYETGSNKHFCGFVGEKVRQNEDFFCQFGEVLPKIEYTIDSAYHANLLNKIYAFMDSKQHIKSHSVVLVMITSMGLKQNSFSSVVNKMLNLDTLFCIVIHKY